MANETLPGTLERPREHRENRKKNLGRKVEENQARAVAKYVRVPPRKARLVIDAIRGRYALDALAFLRFIPNRAATYIGRALASAVANAANNHGLVVDNLKLVEARIDEGPRIKRIKARAQGRAYRILKRTCHITVVVQEVAPKPRKPRKQAGRRAEAARAARRTETAKAPEPQEATPKTRKTEAAAEQTAPAAVQEEAVTTPSNQVPISAQTQPAAGFVESSSEANEVPAPSEDVQDQESAVPGGPQTANTADTTDEIGAPTDTEQA